MDQCLVYLISIMLAVCGDKQFDEKFEKKLGLSFNFGSAPVRSSTFNELVGMCRSVLQNVPSQTTGEETSLKKRS